MRFMRSRSWPTHPRSAESGPQSSRPGRRPAGWPAQVIQWRFAPRQTIATRRQPAPKKVLGGLFNEAPVRSRVFRVNRPFNCGRLSSTVLNLSDSTAVAIAPSELAGCGDGAIAVHRSRSASRVAGAHAPHVYDASPSSRTARRGYAPFPSVWPTGSVPPPPTPLHAARPC